MPMPSTVRLVALPALSLSDALAERLFPSPSIVRSAGQSPATPESSSAQFQPMTTSPWSQPLSFGASLAAPCSDGGVLSMSMPLTPSLAVLPAAAGTGPLGGWYLPSPSRFARGRLSDP